MRSDTAMPRVSASGYRWSFQSGSMIGTRVSGYNLTVVSVVLLVVDSDVLALFSFNTVRLDY